MAQRWQRVAAGRAHRAVQGAQMAALLQRWQTRQVPWGCHRASQARHPDGLPSGESGAGTGVRRGVLSVRLGCDGMAAHYTERPHSAAIAPRRGVGLLPVAVTMSLPDASSAPPPPSPSGEALARQARRLARLPAPWLNEEVARRLADKLGPIRLKPRSWLDWSAHLGAGAALVTQAYPEARRLVAEPHAELAARSREVAHAAASKGWTGLLPWRRPAVPAVWLPGAGDDAAPWSQGGVDLVWANMALHASDDLPTLMALWHRCLAVDGFLMASGLGPDTARELRGLYAELGWGLPTVQFVDMHDLGDELVRAGFGDPVMDMERLTLTWATPAAMLAELRTWGGNVARGRFAGLRTPRWRARLEAALSERLRGPDGRLRLTLELVYAHAVKPVPRAAVAAETRVALDDLRAMVRRPGKP